MTGTEVVVTMIAVMVTVLVSAVVSSGVIKSDRDALLQEMRVMHWQLERIISRIERQYQQPASNPEEIACEVIVKHREQR